MGVYLSFSVGQRCVVVAFNTPYFWLVFFFSHRLSRTRPDETHLKFYVTDIVAFIVAIGVGVWYIGSKHWICSNILGLAFSISGITFLSLGSYKVGAILLCGLFLYDIFWVFGTDVMVTVAKSFDAPIKLLFPRDIFAAEFKHSMLGLGDIVIPGVFVALLLRFDRAQAGLAAPATGAFAKPYFRNTFIGYCVGLITTIVRGLCTTHRQQYRFGICSPRPLASQVVMHVFKHAQPALLYLVPCCLLASLGTAVARGEVAALFAYSEEEEQDAADKDGDAKNK